MHRHDHKQDLLGSCEKLIITCHFCRGVGLQKFSRLGISLYKAFEKENLTDMVNVRYSSLTMIYKASFAFPCPSDISTQNKLNLTLVASNIPNFQYCHGNMIECKTRFSAVPLSIFTQTSAEILP
uniref:Uncharacterized protein n=1 Tax=Sphaerodactylus townsendi TaxID=933632 RepID=A0ACB8EEL7_9SAUR